MVTSMRMAALVSTAFRPCSLANVDFGALVGQSFLLDGENWEVVEADASTRLVKCTRATTERAGDVGPAENDTDGELEDVWRLLTQRR